MQPKKELYPKKLFHMIIEYASKRGEIEGVDIIESIKKHTPIFFLIGNYSWDFDPESKHWIELIDRYEKGENMVDVAYELHIQNYQDPDKKKKWFGCFGYKYVEDENGDGIVKIHFLNDGKSKNGPLSLSEKPKRLTELKEMFEEIREKYPKAKYVEGGSWLYNREEYRRLFPKEYLKDMRTRDPKTKILVIWGQFINSEWEIKEEKYKIFLEKLSRAKNMEDLNNLFEMKELYPRCEIEWFYDFY